MSRLRRYLRAAGDGVVCVAVPFAVLLWLLVGGRKP